MNWMLLLLAFAVKSTALLVVAGLVASTLRRRSAAWRHATWVAAMAGLLVLPLVQATGIGFALPVLPEPAATLTARPTGAAGETHRPASSPLRATPPADHGSAIPFAPSRHVPGRSPASPPWPWPLRVVAGVWLAGTVAILGRLAGQARRLRVIARGGRLPRAAEWERELAQCARAVGLPALPQLVFSEAVPLPVTWGMAPARVALPAEAEGWSAARRRIVLLHELAHVRRRDWLTGWVAETARALYWPHPIVWWAVARLRLESERACDDRVLAAGVRGHSYARHLVDLAGRARVRALAGAVPIAGPSGLAGRVRAILDGTARRETLGGGRLVFLAGTALAVVVAVGCSRLVPGVSGTAASARVADLIAQLSDPRPGARQRAAWALGEREDPRAVPSLVAALRDGDPQVRAMAAWALGEVKDRAALAALLERLEEPDPVSREMVVRAVGELEDARATGRLARLAVDDPLPAVRSAAVWALGESADPPARTAVVGALADPSPLVRVAAARALEGPLQARDVAALERAAEDHDGAVRREVARRLGRSGEVAALDTLRALLRDPLPEVRAEAATALGRIRDPRAVDDLLHRLRDEDPEVRAGAVWALDELES